jgi:membrane peptidoglycan carboxypeptidase
MISALEGALRRGTSRALGAQLPVSQPWAGKTGTSSDLRDAWYVALSPDLVVLSWAGRDDNAQTKFTGATGAMPLAAPLVLAQSKRKQFIEGWSWPTQSVFWKPVVKDQYCKPTELSSAMIKAAIPEPTSSTPPTTPFKYEDKEYYYELFRSGAEVEECR